MIKILFLKAVFVIVYTWHKSDMRLFIPQKLPLFQGFWGIRKRASVSHTEGRWFKSSTAHFYLVSQVLK